MTDPSENPFDRTLSELRAGECALIREVKNRDDHQRLLAMGVCEGRLIELIMPGDPLIIKVFGSRIGISGRLAQDITVELCQQGGCPVAEILSQPAMEKVSSDD